MIPTSILTKDFNIDLTQKEGLAFFFYLKIALYYTLIQNMV